MCAIEVNITFGHPKGTFLSCRSDQKMIRTVPYLVYVVLCLLRKNLELYIEAEADCCSINAHKNLIQFSFIITVFCNANTLRLETADLTRQKEKVAKDIRAEAWHSSRRTVGKKGGNSTDYTETPCSSVHSYTSSTVTALFMPYGGEIYQAYSKKSLLKRALLLLIKNHIFGSNS